MRMFTKIGITLATGALPVLLWAGAADAQQSPPTTRQSQSQSSPTSTANSFPTTTGTGGSLARTGANDLVPLALGGAALGGAIAVRRGLRRRSAA